MTADANAARYGAQLTNKQFGVLIVAIALGTLLEWYDFFAYSQLSAYLTAAFFPSADPAVQQLSFWGVYAVGFISRPIGALGFGHLGDTKGRRITLLISVTMMAVPTVLIGALPTFAQAGMAAPALLAILRAIQGLAMGGEFGCAMVYLHEIASADRKGLVGSIGFASAMIGCMLGVLVVLIVESIFNESQMLLFGWRIPFLISMISATAAFALRMHMPEPEEFVQERKDVIRQNLMRIASQRMSPAGGSFSRSFLSRKFSGLSGTSQTDAHHEVHSTSHGVNVTGKLHSLLEDDTVTSKVTETTKDATTMATPALQTDANIEVFGVEGIPEKRGEYIPAMRLLRKHWAGVVLQILFETWVSIGFYVITSWLPVQLKKAPVNMPEKLTQAMLIVNLVIMGGSQLLAGWASDKGMPRVWSCFGVYVVAAAISVPTFMAFAHAGVAGAWLLHLLLMVMMGWVLGVVPATCSSIYPATVRSSGFNLAHNIAMSWLGGISPTIVTALVAATGRTYLAPSLLLTAAAAVSMLAAVGLLKYAPESNRTTVEEHAV